MTMKKFRDRAIVSLAVILLAGTVAWAEPEEARDDDEPTPVTVVGDVEIADEDDEGDIRQVYIMDLDLGPVLVANEARGRELHAHVGRTVKVKGQLEESDEPGFEHQVRVASFTLVTNVFEEDSELNDPEE